MTGALAFCDPPCEGDSLCTATDTCTPLPAAQSAGTLTLGDEELEPTGGLYAASAETALFAPTATITATAAGDAFPAFTSAPLAVPDPLTGATYPGGLRAGEDYTLTWTPAADTGSSVGVVLRTDLGHGPIAKSIIYCAVDDAAGTLTVPSSLIDPHVDPANWSCGDCFPSWLYRFRSTTGADGVNLWFGQGVDVYAVPDRG